MEQMTPQYMNRHFMPDCRAVLAAIPIDTTTLWETNHRTPLPRMRLTDILDRLVAEAPVDQTSHGQTVEYQARGGVPAEPSKERTQHVAVRVEKVILEQFTKHLICDDRATVEVLHDHR